MYLVEEFKYKTLSELQQKRNAFKDYEIEAVVKRDTVGYGLDYEHVLTVILKEKDVCNCNIDIFDWLGSGDEDTE